MENRRNYYRILQVQPGAPVEIIRASYRTLMQRLRAHPDLGGDHRNAALINEAYAVLTNPAKRAEYDREFQARVLDTRSDPGEAAESAAAGPRHRPAADGERCLFCDRPHQSRPARQPDARCAACGSPLHPVTARQLAADGQRTIQRLPRHHALRVFTHWPQAAFYAAESRDVSPNGISFVTRELLPPHAVIKVDGDWCVAVARIANIRVDDTLDDGSWLVGAEFLSVIFPRSRGAFLSTEA